MSNFKVGDVLEYVFKGTSPNSHRVGQIAIVLEINEKGGLYVQWMDGSIGGAETKYILASSFKLADSETKMEADKLKNFNPKNLAEGKKRAEQERAEYETQEAKKVYTDLINKRDEQNRIKKEADEKLKEINKELNVFK